MTYTSNKSSKTYILAQNGEKPLRFFTQALKDGQHEIELPTGYVVSENDKTGMPMLKKSV
jgi:hypothetical protein